MTNARSSLRTRRIKPNWARTLAVRSSTEGVRWGFTCLMLLEVLTQMLLCLATSSGSAPSSRPPIRRVRWSADTSIVDLMAEARPVILTGSPAEAWASEHWSAAELRSRLEILYNVRWSSTQRSFTYFTGKEWSARFGSPMERAAARFARKDPDPLSGWSPGQPKHQRRPTLRLESAQPHNVANILPAEDLFAHVVAAAANGTVAPPFYYSSGAIDEKVVVHEGAPPLLPELTEGLLPLLEPLPQYDIRPHLWLGQPGVSVTLHYDTNDNTYIQLHGAPYTGFIVSSVICACKSNDSSYPLGAKRFILLPPSAARYVYLLRTTLVQRRAFSVSAVPVSLSALSLSPSALSLSASFLLSLSPSLPLCSVSLSLLCFCSVSLCPGQRIMYGEQVPAPRASPPQRAG